MKFAPIIASIGLFCAAPTYAAGVQWTYDDDHIGQDNWGDLSTAFATCGKGLEQSPVHLAYSKPDNDLPKLEFHYQNADVVVAHLGYAIALQPQTTENKLVVGDTAFTLKRIEFHSPSEHTLPQYDYPFEMQFVHVNAKGQWLTVSVFADKGAENAAIASLIQDMPAKQGETHFSTVDLNALLPEKRGYYAYRGSMTVPPCTEGIEWRVLKNPVKLSKAQLMAFIDKTQRNARFVQPIYLRTIKETPE